VGHDRDTVSAARDIQKTEAVTPPIDQPQATAKPLSALLISLVVTVLALRLRVGDVGFLDFMGRSLWAEDGNIFLNQAGEFGVRSLWTSYAGYLHLYSRLFALSAYRLDLIYVPWIFAFGYVLAFSYSMYVVGRSLLTRRLGLWTVLLCALAIGCQPHTGELFLTITNAQWFLAVALSVIILLPSRNALAAEPIVVLALSLTGPFCVLLVPAMLIHVAVNRDFRARWATYAALMCGAAVQLWFVLASGRGSGTGINLEWRQWARVAFDTATFGGNNWPVIAASLLFWVAFFAGVYAVARRQGRAALVLPGTLLAAAGFLYLGGVWAFKDAPGGLNPVLANARYFLGPYSLLFIAATLIWSQVPRLLWLGMACLATICVIQFRTIARQDLQFESYAAFAGQVSNLIIPLPPANAEFPGWHIDADLLVPVRPSREVVRYESDEALATLLVSQGQEIRMDTRGQCHAATHAGLEIEMTRPNAGWTKLSWGTGDPHSSLPRFYPQGRVTAQYAFPRATSAEDVRLEPGAPLEQTTIHAVRLYCL
jgi:hypothetical protein